MRVLAVLIISCASLAQEAPRIVHQKLYLRIDPAKGTFHCKATVLYDGARPPDLGEFDGVESTVVSVKRHKDGLQQLEAEYSGRIVNPVEKPGAATWVTGDRPGTISEKGSYLVRGFYVPVSQPCTFDVAIQIAPPYRAVSAGTRVDEDHKGYARYRCDYPVYAIAVVTGPWVVEERVIDGVTCRTYLYEQDRAHAKILLDSLEVEVVRFQKLFGPLPGGRFDVVENLLTTSGGGPNFTLLGDTVLRLVCAETVRAGRKTLPPGFLDRELVRCWLGNFLRVDYKAGNWRSALTTYFTNYAAAEREKDDAAYRRRVSRDFSLRVGPENDYPLRAFREKRHHFENDIGHGKGSMVFHMLAREIGRDKLAAGVRHVVQTKGGRKLGWDGLVKGLSEAAGRDLAAWFEPWLSRKGAPVLRLGAVTVSGRRVTGTLMQVQEGEAYDLRVLLRLRTEAGVEQHEVHCASRETAFSIEAGAAPRLLEVDPDHHVFRRVLRKHVAPCMLAVLTAPKKIGFGHQALLKRVKVPAAEPALPKDKAVLAIGLAPAVRNQLLRGARIQDASFTVKQGSFDFRGKTYDQPGDGILLTFARPASPGLPVTLFHGNTKAAFARVRYLPDHAAHGWVVFRGGRPLARGSYGGDRGTRAELTGARNGKPESLVSDLLWLTGAEHKGRRAGSMEAYKLANHLRGRLHTLGLEVHAWPPVTAYTGSCPAKREIVLVDADPKVVVAGDFYPFHLSGSPKRPAIFERVVRHPANDPKGALVLLSEDSPHTLARDYAAKGAAAVAVVSKDREFGARGHEAAWQGALPPAVARQLARRGKTDIALAVSVLMARSYGRPLSIPYLYLDPELATALKQYGKRGVIRFRLERKPISTSNIVGTLGSGRERGVLLSAHWDGVGSIGGKPAQGASHNAAGVAVVLWVAEQLKRDHDAGRLKGPVVVALFGAKEMGLWGSRQFAVTVRSPQSSVAKPVAAVNVDGIGSNRSGTVYLIGRSQDPELLEAFRRALKGTGLRLGRDIDESAFRHGSDHWPLHEAGVPAVSVSCAELPSSNALADTLARLDVGLVRDTAKAVYRMVRDLATR